MNKHNLASKIFPEYELAYQAGIDYANLLLQMATVVIALSLLTVLVRRVMRTTLVQQQQDMLAPSMIEGDAPVAAVEYFDLYFQGECLEGKSVQQVGEALSKMFNLTPEKTQSLFNGKRTTVRRRVSRSGAERYAHAFRLAGAVLQVFSAAAPTGEGEQPDA